MINPQKAAVEFVTDYAKQHGVQLAECNAKIFCTVAEIAHKLIHRQRVEIPLYAKPLLMSEFKRHGIPEAYNIPALYFKPTADGWQVEIAK